MRKTREQTADEVEVGQLIHVPKFITAPDRVDKITQVVVDFVTGLTTITAAGETWKVPSTNYVKVTLP
jgi:hypothetical protein